MSYRSGGTSQGVLDLRAPPTPPAVSGVGEGRIYFDGTAFKVSENGSAYVTLTGGGGGTPGGANTNVQYNDSGSFGGDANMTWNKATQHFSVSGVVLTGNGSAAAPGFSFVNGANYGLKLRPANGSWDGVAAGNTAFSVNTTSFPGFCLSASLPFQWSSAASDAANPDAAFSRLTTASVALGSGAQGDTSGSLSLRTVVFNGSTSGSITLAAPAVAGTQAYTLPPNTGTNGYFLQTDGAGVLSWAAGGGGSTTLQGAYTTGGAGGGAILLTASGGPLAITNPSGASQAGLAITQSNTGSLGAQIAVQSGATGLSIRDDGGSGAASNSIIDGRVASVVDNGSVRYNVGLFDSTALAAGVGAGVRFGGLVNGSGSYQGFAAVNVAKANATVNDAGGSLVLSTRPTGAFGGTQIAEAMRINSSQQVLVGTTTPISSEKLLVAGNVAVQGSVILAGSTSGTISITAPAVAGAQSYTLPPNTGSDGFVLQTDGAGILTWGPGSGTEKIVPFAAGTYQLTAANAGWTATNTGALGSITFTLPQITAGMVGKVFLFAVTDAQLVTISNFNATSTIYIGVTASTAGGTVFSNLVGSMLRIVAVSTTQWFGEIVTGKWTPS